jgi:regulatory protein
MPLRRTRSSLSPENAGDLCAARLAALALLAGRDFAPLELRERLTRRGFEAGTAQAVIDELIGRGYLNEARYVESYVSWHAARGQGPLRIGAELKRQGLASELIDGALATGADWAALARKVCQAKFGAKPPRGWPEKARQMRFLQYRGFSADHIRAATGADPDWTEEP